MSDLRAIAIYLPQFHPIPENDAWWGKGFTEWTNVTKARPLFQGHDQPHLPADLGFYDLRLAETREAQANLARDHGIHGFCYYHYWFNGRRLLERPFHEVLDSGRPDFPFCLCWANENWTRRWDGAEHEILVRQVYSDEDDRNHLQWLARAFSDPRYIRVEGKPLFLVYRTSRMPDPLRSTTIWREEARRLGLGELFLVRVESFDAGTDVDPRPLGFDAAMEFMPDFDLLYGLKIRLDNRWTEPAAALGLLRGARLEKVRAFENNYIGDYETLVKNVLSREPVPYNRFRCVSPGWDNSPRLSKGGAHALVGSTPERYGRWLRAASIEAGKNPPEHRIVFLNAWNEWAEGNHLEPCRRWGRGYLEATREALNG